VDSLDRAESSRQCIDGPVVKQTRNHDLFALHCGWRYHDETRTSTTAIEEAFLDPSRNPSRCPPLLCVNRPERKEAGISSKQLPIIQASMSPSKALTSKAASPPLWSQIVILVSPTNSTPSPITHSRLLPCQPLQPHSKNPHLGPHVIQA